MSARRIAVRRQARELVFWSDSAGQYLHFRTCEPSCQLFAEPDRTKK